MPCAVWGKRGDVIAKYCRKGNRLLIAGELRITPYTTKEGLRRDMVDINVNDFTLIDRNEGVGTATAPTAAARPAPAPAGSRPSPAAPPYNSPFDEEVPF